MKEKIYRLPAEWEPQSAIMLTWPHTNTIWAETLTAIDQVFTQIATEIAKRQQVIISCANTQHQTHIKKLLAKANLTQIHFFILPSDDIWVRDHGPITIQENNQPIILDFNFNGWGNKYPAENDNNITHTLKKYGAFHETPHNMVDFVLEGGAIEVDGQGTLLTTPCILHRHPHLSQSDIENKLGDWLGIKKFLWLMHGQLAGDDTDGHIDTLARFVDAKTICYVQCDDEEDEHFISFKQMEEQLKTFKDINNHPYQLIPLPWPRARFADFDGRRLPATYANFLIINDAVLVPTYDDPADHLALDILASCFTDREIIPIPSLSIIQWYGSVHCMTMQLPANVR